MNLLNETLQKIQGLNEETMSQAKAHMDDLIKPIGSLGKLEGLAIQLSGITGKVKNDLSKKCTVVMSADNGVLDEGFSTTPQIVTFVQTLNMAKQVCGINVLSEVAAADIKVIDIGVKGEIEDPFIINKKIRQGTSNMAQGPAMTYEEAVQALEVGIEAVNELVASGYQVIGTGEMGIGNTATSSAIMMTFLGCSPDIAVGKGAGLSEADHQKKKDTICKAIEINQPDPKDPIDVLAKVGGFDIAGLVGCYLAAAANQVPIVVDGFISTTAALVASKLDAQTKEYMIGSHVSDEPGFKALSEALGIAPMFDLNMRLGEGTGCPFTFNLIDSVNNVMNKMATFSEGNIDSDALVDIRED